MIKIEKIKNLVKELNEASDHYYNTGRPIMHDAQWDRKFQELKELENETGYVLSNSPTQNVGFEVRSKLNKVQHEIPLLSLDKTKNIDDIQKFISNKECLVSLKLDGLTTELIYQNGTLIEASTRGDGYTGESILHNVKTFKNIPLTIPFKGELKISGESIILQNDFENTNTQLTEENKYKNARNLTAGSVRQLDSEKCAARNVRFYAFNMLKVEGVEFEKKSEQFEWLLEQGFEVAGYCVFKSKNIEVITQIFDSLTNMANKYGIGIDGLVITYNDINYSNSLGTTAHHPRHSLAYKMADEGVETKFLGIEWETSRTGWINPTAYFEPVEIDGTTVSKATLHNLDYIQQLELGIGDTILVVKANMIIPKVIDNLTRSNSIEIPKECPTCGSPTKVKTLKEANVLICTNNDCPARFIDALEHFVSRKAMNIDGLSGKTLEKFVNKGFIKNYPDIFSLEFFNTEIINMPGWGRKSYNKLIEAVNNVREVELYRLIYGLGIPGIGEVSAKNLCKYFNNDIEKIIKANINELEQVKDFGENMAKNVYDYFMCFDNINTLELLLKEIKIKKEQNKVANSKITGKTFCITGKLSRKRDEFKQIIEDNGGKVTDSISNKTDFLLAGEKVGASKINKAEQCGTQIITEEEFWNMMEE